MLINIPAKEEIKLTVGDEVYLSGELITARDMAHRRLAKEGASLAVNFNVIYHCGPLVKKTNGLKILSAGPTSSTRLNSYTRTMAEKFGTRLFIGKGGMDAESSRVFEEFGCAYLAFTGGAGVLAAKGIKEVLAVHWEELGMPEAIWHLRVENFGPLIVAMDSTGESLYDRQSGWSK